MFGWIKNIFTGSPESDSGALNLITGENTMVGKIIETGNSFTLVDRHNNTVATYTRRRDAVRGAARRGLVVKA